MVGSLVRGLAGYTHREITERCAALGIRVPDEGTKAERVDGAVAGLLPADHEAVMARYLALGYANPPQRNAIEDLQWSQRDYPAITQRTRREIAAAMPEPIWGDADGFMRLLDQLWVLEDDTSWWTGKTLRDQIIRHMIHNRDWEAIELFKALGALDASDHRFALFIEGLLSGRVNPDEPTQRAMAASISHVLSAAGLRLDETGTDDGYPAFTIVDAGRSRHLPPQLILFASISKPDLRLPDVIDKRLEVLGSHADVLHYDRPVGRDGLTWADLQRWYAGLSELSAEQAKDKLYQRLQAAIPIGSPPQHTFFATYHTRFGRRDVAVCRVAARGVASLGPPDPTRPRRARLRPAANGLPDAAAEPPPRRARDRRRPALCPGWKT